MSRLELHGVPTVLNLVRSSFSALYALNTYPIAAIFPSVFNELSYSHLILGSEVFCKLACIHQAPVRPGHERCGLVRSSMVIIQDCLPSRHPLGHPNAPVPEKTDLLLPWVRLPRQPRRWSRAVRSSSGDDERAHQSRDGLVRVRGGLRHEHRTISRVLQTRAPLSEAVSSRPMRSPSARFSR